MQKIIDNANNAHTTFKIHGKCVTLKTKIKRTETPNFVDKWAADNNINLKSGCGSPEVA